MGNLTRQQMRKYQKARRNKLRTCDRDELKLIEPVYKTMVHNHPHVQKYISWLKGAKNVQS